MQTSTEQENMAVRDRCYTVAKSDNGQIVEENLMDDLVAFMKQIGLSK